jgi:hypothetical protein
VKTTATSLSYVDPPGTGWRLVKDPGSTATHLVLSLVGPAGTLTRGVGLNVKGGAGVRWAAFEDGLPVRDLGVYELRSAADEPSEAVALAGGLLRDNVLTVGIFQKDRARAAKDSGRPLLQIAFDLDAAAGLSAGDAVALSVTKAKAIPEDIGRADDPAVAAWMKMTDLTVAVGALAAR